MSDSLEKFVLQYEVRLEDAIARLERLNSTVERTNKKSKSSTKSLKDLGRGAAEEIGKISPQLQMATRAALGLTTGLVGVAGALAVIAAGVKAIIMLRKEYSEQRALSFTAGMNPLEIEQFQRQAVGVNGKINAQQARGIIEKTQNMAMGAYTNTNPINEQQMKLAGMGTTAFNPDGKINDTMKMLDQMSDKMNKMTKEQAYAVGQASGFTRDEIDAIRGRTEAIRKSTEISKDEKVLREDANKSMENLNSMFGRIDENMRRVGTVIGADLMPYLERVVKFISDLSEKAPSFAMDMIDDLKAQTNASLKTFWDGGAGYSERFDKVLAEERKSIAEERAKRKVISDSTNAESRRQQAQFQRDINLFSAAVAQFSGVVDERQAIAAWAGEIGKSAGIGPQAGVGSNATGANAGTPVQGASVAPVVYKSLIENAAAKQGIDPMLIAKVIHTESRFNPNAVSGAGAVGLGQIMPGNFKSLGITNPYDPEQNINGTAKLLKEYITYTKGDIEEALRMYHGGYKKSGWGPLTMSYPGKVLNSNVSFDSPNKATNGYTPVSTGNASSISVPMVPMDVTNKGNQMTSLVGGAPVKVEVVNGVESKIPLEAKLDNQGLYQPSSPAYSPVANLGDKDYSRVSAPPGHNAPVIGQTREDIRFRQVVQSVAQNLGMPEQQVFTGGVTRGDMDFMLTRLKSGETTSMLRAVNTMNAPGTLPRAVAEARLEAQRAINNMNAIDESRGRLMGMAKEGGRDLTVGMPNIEINVYEAKNAQETAGAVGDKMQSVVGDLINGLASGVKY